MRKENLKSGRMNDILQYAIDNGIIDLRGVCEEVELRRKQEILDSHHIWKGKNGYYYSKVNGRLIKRKQLSDLNEALLELQDGQTVTEIFNLYLDNKRNVQPSTIARYESCFKTYFSKLEDKKISQVTEYDIEQFIVHYLDKGLSAKEYGNIRTVLNGIFKLAKKLDLINFRISETLEDLNITHKDFLPKQHKKQVLNTTEYLMITDYLTNNLDLVNLGLLLMLKTGLRVGELVALTPDDIGRHDITVNKTEQRVRTDYQVVERTKTEAGTRTVIVADQDLWILRELKLRRTFSKRIFDFTTNAVRHRLENVCDKLGIEKVSPHKLRKTYASRLFSAKVDEQFICSQMGHTDIRTTKQYYIKDTLTYDEKVKMLSRVT